MVYFEKKSMDVERKEGGLRASEMEGEMPKYAAPVQERGAVAPPEASSDASIEARRQAAARAARPAREMKDQLLTRIEATLSEGLADEYATLSPKQKQEFKQSGERLAQWLHEEVANGKISPHHVLSRLEDWLLIIEAKDRSSPWLLQEAYVRARRIMKDFVYPTRGH